MKKILTIIALVALSLPAVAKRTVRKPLLQRRVPVINLTSRNTLTLRTEVDAASVSDLSRKAINLSHNLARNEVIFLFMDTPGGSVEAGSQLISVLNGLPQRVDTITNFAASMGFHIVESLTNSSRFILPNGVLMSHRASATVGGHIPGELTTRVKFFVQQLGDQDATIARRVGLSKKAYERLIHDEYWVTGERAVEANMADHEVLVRCSKALAEGTVKTEVQTFLGSVEVTYSTCPLITAPLAISFNKLMQNDSITDSQILELHKAVLELLYNKQEFYNNYILTNKYTKLMP